MKRQHHTKPTNQSRWPGNWTVGRLGAPKLVHKRRSPRELYTAANGRKAIILSHHSSNMAPKRETRDYEWIPGKVYTCNQAQKALDLYELCAIGRNMQGKTKGKTKGVIVALASPLKIAMVRERSLQESSLLRSKSEIEMLSLCPFYLSFCFLSEAGKHAVLQRLSC